jgi:hypothetical protein
VNQAACVWRGNGKQEIEDRESEVLLRDEVGPLRTEKRSAADNYQGRCCELGASSGACAAVIDMLFCTRVECVLPKPANKCVPSPPHSRRAPTKEPLHN